MDSFVLDFPTVVNNPKKQKNGIIDKFSNYVAKAAKTYDIISKKNMQMDINQL